jgi:hypothetical protein
MTALLTIFKGLWGWIGWAITTAFQAWQKLEATKWTIMVLVVNWLYISVVHAADFAGRAVAAINSVLVNGFDASIPSSVWTIINTANTFFPLDALFVYSVNYGLLIVGLTGYRWIKTMVPLWGAT